MKRFTKPIQHALSAILFGLVAQTMVAAERPNIVWIFAEDMNDWMGCYGDDTVPTPNIDRLAESGTRFDPAYMPAGVCSATRSAIFGRVRGSRIRTKILTERLRGIFPYQLATGNTVRSRNVGWSMRHRSGDS